jgi:2-C-methyl-D-erythritol 4-phosphate cytidylyltransferase
MQRYAIIVAGGKGERMGAEIPKQFLPLAGMPVLMHTLQRFYKAGEHTHLILVLPQKHLAVWEELCRCHGFSVPHQVVAGGAERFFSVRNGLDTITAEEGLVAVHDGVRPLVDASLIHRTFAQAEQSGTAVASVKLKDSVRHLDNNGSCAVDRNEYVLVQTPQVFRLSLLRKAYTTAYSSIFTDDASVVEATGVKITLAEGAYSNIKITTADDLALAEVLLAKELKS